MANYQILTGNSKKVLQSLKSDSVQLEVCSPPYYRMRRYNGNDDVFGGDESCEHEWGKGVTKRNFGDTSKSADKQKSNAGTIIESEYEYEYGTCVKCGAWLGQLGWEETPELFVSHLCDILDESRRVLKDTGVLFVNMGDTYSGSQKGYNGDGTWQDRSKTKQGTNGGSIGLLPTNLEEYGYKAKDLILIPHMVAAELRRRGWYLRAEIPWIVPNKMPGPWKDRPIVGHEWFFMLTKSAKCSYDAEKVLIKTQYKGSKTPRYKAKIGQGDNHGKSSMFNGDFVQNPNGRNRRTSDWFLESLDGTIEFYKDYVDYLESFRNGNEDLLIDETGDPLALIVNNHPSSLKHFAMYNENLIRPLIQACTEKGDVVLDPFCGTATTGRIALDMDRDFIGIDVSEEYSGIARTELDKIVNRPQQIELA